MRKNKQGKGFPMISPVTNKMYARGPAREITHVEQNKCKLTIYIM